MISAIIIMVTLSWVPLAMIYNAQATPSAKPPVHIMQDMAQQPKLKAQSPSSVFADGRGMRPPVPGTVARGEIINDEHYLRGFTLQRNEQTGGWDTNYFRGFPQQIAVNESFVLRGQKMFNTFCYPCHGLDGYGNGPVNQRALQLNENDSARNAWIPAVNIHALDNAGKLQFGDEIYPEGRLFNTISNGIRNMAGYSSQIEIEDRWAIVAYVRALQLSQHAPAELVPAEHLGSMK
jgi:mono/diheme cytochrome c family protein